MPTISYDAQSLMIDGRRIWLVSGELHYARIPQELWRNRLVAARQAGLNCITTSIPWNQHEPQPGLFEFEGQLDLRRFVKLAGELGMFCILRPGPYVGDGYDLGGMPAWLLRTQAVKLRQASGPFMEAAARYLGEVLEQVKDLQVTAIAQPGYNTSAIGGGGGPIVLMQAEHHWFCHHPQQGEAYLRELVRYLRENGCTVPVTLANNLWQPVEGTIDTWCADDHLLTDLRQLAAVQPHAPRLVSELPLTAGSPKNPAQVLQGALVQVLAAGGQYNLTCLDQGFSWGFMGGRHPGRGWDVAAPCNAASSLFSESSRTLFRAVKQVSTFATQFGHVLASMEADRHHATVALDRVDHPTGVVHLRGGQGQIVFLFPEQRTPPGHHVELLLPTGRRVSVPLTGDPAQWIMVDANLAGAALLDYTNLCPWAFIARRLLVLYGPAGAKGLVSLNGAVLEVTVPPGKDHKPWIGRHEGLTLAVLSREQLDAAWVTAQGLVLGAASLDENDQPAGPAGKTPAMILTPRGETMHPADRARKTRPLARPPAFEPWQVCPMTEYLEGSSPDYQAIPGPQPLESLDPVSAYGWYRLNLPRPLRETMLAPGAGDRLHLYQEGRHRLTVGMGLGATSSPFKTALAGTLVILADTPGRWSEGWRMEEPKGLFDHFYAVKPVKLSRPPLVPARGVNLWSLGQFWNSLRQGDPGICQSLAWSIFLERGQSLIVELQDQPVPCMIFCNGQAVGMYHPQQSDGFVRLAIHPGRGLLKTGENELKLVLLAAPPDQTPPGQGVNVWVATGNLTADAAWAFAPWKVPNPSQFMAMPRTLKPGEPRWYRTQFHLGTLVPSLCLELTGLSKGQLYLNGRNLGRYWAGHPQGKPLPGRHLHLLPASWLRPQTPNELSIFDEHGLSPVKCRWAAPGGFSPQKRPVAGKRRSGG